MADLDVRCRLISNGVTLALEGGATYSLGSETRSSAGVSHRMHKVSSPYVEGEFTVHAVRENVVEPLEVYIEAATRAAFQTAKNNLELALSYPNFKLEWDWGKPGDGSVLRETWTCFAAGYTVETSQPLMIAKLGLVRAQIPRLPTVTTATVTI